MSEKYIMQSSKGHAAQQKGARYAAEQLGTIYCLQKGDESRLVQAELSTPVATSHVAAAQSSIWGITEA